MSEQEFDLYLSLMSRLLKLSPPQSAAINDELRDHLEQRFTELTRAGLSRDVAIQKALEEFGDATVLAQDFAALAHRKRRSFWARMSVGLAGLAVALVVGLFTLWPSPHQATRYEQLVAADAPATDAPSARIRYVDATALYPVELSRPTEFNFVETPLSDVGEWIATKHNLPVIVDQRTLQATGIDLAATTLTLKCSGIPLHLALDRLVQVMTDEIQWNYDNGVLTFTTIEKADQLRFTKTYDLSALSKLGCRPTELIKTLRASTTGNWAISSSAEVVTEGTCTMNLLGDQLVINANARSQRQVTALLRSLQQVLEGEADVVVDQPVENLAIEKVYEQPLDVRFSDSTLRDALDYLESVTSVPLHVEARSLANAGVNLDETKVSLRPMKRPLSVILPQLLTDVSDGAVAFPYLGMLWIAEREGENDGLAKKYGYPVVYHVKPFTTAELVDELEETIYNLGGTGDQNSWDWNSGHGRLSRPHPDLFVIWQTHAVHRAIQGFLGEQLSRLAKRENVPVTRPLETRTYEICEDLTDVARVIRATIANDWDDLPEQVVEGKPVSATKWIMTVRTPPHKPGAAPAGGHGGQAPRGGGGGFFQFGGDGLPARTSTVRPGAMTTLEVTGHLVIRHDRTVHRRIDRLLLSLRVGELAQWNVSGPHPEFGRLVED